MYRLLHYNEARRALIVISRYTKLFKSDTAIALALGYTFSQLKLEDQFQRQIALISKYFEGMPHLIILKASHFAEKGEYENAINEMHEAIKVDEKEPASFNNLGYYQSKMGLYHESIPNFNKSIELDPKFYFAFSNRAYSKLMLGDASSIDDIKYSLKKYPNNAVALKNLALWEMKFGDSRKVAALVKKAKSKKFYAQTKDELEDLEELSSN